MNTIINGVEYKLIRKPFGEVSILEFVDGINSAEYRMKSDTINNVVDFENQCYAIQQSYN